ncbi:aryl-sulfate sulfotransferase [Myxococcota bacterium]|nr:aryl-sulfate sulfotransferase [Myxococcota bacterium]
MRTLEPLLLAALVWGCQPIDHGDVSLDDDTSDDDTVDEVPVIVTLEATATVSPEISTVATITWTTVAPGTSVVEFGPDEEYGYQTVDDGGLRTSHAVVLAGLSVNSTWHWRARSALDGEVHVSPDQTIQTGPAPSELPSLTVDPEDPSRTHPVFTVTSFVGDEASHIVALGPDGRYVWWQLGAPDHLYARALLARNGRDIVFNVAGADREVDISEVVRMSLDKQTTVHTRTPFGHHDFVELPEGGIAYLALDCREVDGHDHPVCGEALVELEEGSQSEDPVGDGAAVVIWSSWSEEEGIPLDVDPHAEPEFYPQGVDWLHGNGLQLEEDLGSDGVYLYSSRNLSAVFAIDRATGQMLWQVGGEDSDFRVGPDSTAFLGQHAPDLLDSGTHLLLFDNGAEEHLQATGGGLANSAAREYHLDADADPMKYDEVWSFTYGGYSLLLGDAVRLDNGNTHVSWGSMGVLNQISPEGDVVWQVNTPIGNALSFIDAVERIGGSLE